MNFAQAVDSESAAENAVGKIGIDDRTEAFDVYQWEMEDCVINVTDIGGHDDYNLMLPLLCRNHGLFLLVVSSESLMTNEKKAHDQLWQWVKKIMEVSLGPQFVVILTKTDKLQGLQ